jgi:hypothetical protein
MTTATSNHPARCAQSGQGLSPVPRRDDARPSRRRTPARTSVLVATGIAVASCALALVGCASGTFSADVRNNAPATVRVELVEVEASGSEFVRGSITLAPGDRAGLGPFNANPDAVGKLVISSSRAGEPITWPLDRGTNAVEIRDDDATGTLRPRSRK